MSLNALLEKGGDIETVSVIHASRPDHMDEHEEWIHERLRSDIQDGEDLWNRKADLLPSLIFCETAERQLRDLSTTMLRPVVRRLFELDSYCQEWTKGGFDPGQLPSKTTPESQATLEQYGTKRTFRCPGGVERIFRWHVRVTPGAWRIYFHLNSETKTMLIGYIGRKLPTARYPK